MYDFHSKEHFLSFGIGELDKEKFDEIKNQPCSNKPIGGLWASPIINDDKYICSWERWCIQNSFDGLSEDFILFNLENNANIYTLDKQEDLVILIKNYTEVNPFESFGYSHKDYLPKAFTYPNYEEIAKDYDGIYLTESGIRELRLPLKKWEYNLYGWDCSSLVLFNLECIGAYRSLKYQRKWDKNKTLIK